MYAVVDLETTGSHPNHDNIIEIAIYLHDGYVVTDQFCTLVNPGSSIPPFISKLTGITNDMVESAPTFQSIAPKLAEILSGRIFVAHNVQFDHSFLKQSMLRHGYEITQEMLCTVRTGRALLPGLASYKLSSLCKALDIRLDNAHRAYADALATAHILTFLNEKASGNLEPYKYQKEIRKNPSKIPAETIDELPSQAGLLHFLNESGEIILTNASSNIRKKAWSLVKRFHHKRLLPIATEATAVQYEITHSEILASILEIQICQTSKPKFNRNQRVMESRFMVIDQLDANGFINLHLSPLDSTSVRHRTFSSIGEGRKTLAELQKQFNLLIGVNQSSGSIMLDDPNTHNQKMEAAIRWLGDGVQASIVYDKLTQNGEQTVFWMHDQSVIGYCMLKKTDSITHTDQIKERLTLLSDDPAIFRTLNRFIARGKIRKITKIANPNETKR